MRLIDVYEDDEAGQLYLHRRGDSYVVCRGDPELSNSLAQEDCASYSDWAGSKGEAESNGWDTIKPDDLDVWWIEHIATLTDTGAFSWIGKPRKAGNIYLERNED